MLSNGNLNNGVIATDSGGDGMDNPMTNQGDMIVGGAPADGVAPPVRLGKGTSLQSLGINPTTGLPTWISPYQYSKMRYVDPNGGSDSYGDGSYGNPYKTVAFALTKITTGMIICLIGQTTEAALSIPATLTNIDIIALGSRSALNGFNNKVTVLGTGAGSVRFQGLNFGGGLERASTCNCGIYVYNGSIGATGFVQSGAGYTEFVSVDASNGPVTLSAGTSVFYGGKLIAPVITGAVTVVTLDNVGTVIGNGTMAAGGTLTILDTNWIAAASGYALTSSASTVTAMQGNNFIRPNGTLASISVSNYDIQDTDYDKANSVLGSHVGNYDWFARIGLLNTDTITTATKMLVRKATGELAEQVIPVIPTNLVQFNAPVSSLYSVDTTVTAIPLKTSSGTAQTTQQVQLCNANGMITLDQIFCATLAVGKTLTYKGKLVVYNAETITQTNYYVTVQPVGALAGSGQWVNLGDSTQVQLSKVQYAYTPVVFSGSYTNPSGSAIEAIGVRITLQYGQLNATAFVDTLFIEGNVN